MVHAPDESARRRVPEWYDFPDESLAIVEGIRALREEHAGHVHFVLGNHDHGHDRDSNGWFVENGNQLCPVIFGAPRENKRYVLLDLSRRYQGVSELRDEEEIRRLYP